MLKILGGAVGLLFAITLFLAFAGAIVALFGGMAGFENARVAGGAVSGIGALGFFALLLSPLGELLGLLGTSTPTGSSQLNVNASAPPNPGKPGKKEVTDDRIA
ncbi:hypothetical protein AB7714_05300 [Tardiphaga sp. 1201_B9_N1_1]|jgi:hypothetical protein|uniref:hypothetical protein n=1 Tax=unclassified Tardiphaga TaxID=2631404 RepID=UPI000E724008|nr:hypothetical protein [Tardiphaga sp. 37S4]UFS77870.1 hypothetical protein LPB73_11025 [Tardiphaga sp. 37S4]